VPIQSLDRVFRGIDRNVARSIAKRDEWYRRVRCCLTGCWLSCSVSIGIGCANGRSFPLRSNIIICLRGRRLHYAPHCQAVDGLQTDLVDALLGDCSIHVTRRTKARYEVLLDALLLARRFLRRFRTQIAQPAHRIGSGVIIVNVILTIPGRVWRVRSLPMKEGVLTWEQCSRVLVPTKLLREPT
jgi:hypothetical protein